MGESSFSLGLVLQECCPWEFLSSASGWRACSIRQVIGMDTKLERGSNESSGDEVELRER